MWFNPVPMSIREAYRARHEPEAQRVLGTFYWTILVILLILMVGGGLGYGAWQFKQPLVEGTEESVSVSAKKVITRTEIEKVLQAFEARSSKYDERLNAPPPVKDPS